MSFVAINQGAHILALLPVDVVDVRACNIVALRLVRLQAWESQNINVRYWVQTGNFAARASSTAFDPIRTSRAECLRSEKAVLSTCR
jgi:hypothetical protein